MARKGIAALTEEAEGQARTEFQEQPWLFWAWLAEHEVPTLDDTSRKALMFRWTDLWHSQLREGELAALLCMVPPADVATVLDLLKDQWVDHRSAQILEEWKAEAARNEEDVRSTAFDLERQFA